MLSIQRSFILRCPQKDNKFCFNSQEQESQAKGIAKHSRSLWASDSACSWNPRWWPCHHHGLFLFCHLLFLLLFLLIFFLLHFLRFSETGSFLCRPELPSIYNLPHASASQALGLQACSLTPGCLTGFQINFKYGRSVSLMDTTI